MNRRQVLLGTGATAAALLPGCGGPGDDNETDDDGGIDYGLEGPATGDAAT